MTNPQNPEELVTFEGVEMSRQHMTWIMRMYRQFGEARTLWLARELIAYEQAHGLEPDAALSDEHQAGLQAYIDARRGEAPPLPGTEEGTAPSPYESQVVSTVQRDPEGKRWHSEEPVPYPGNSLRFDSAEEAVADVAEAHATMDARLAELAAVVGEDLARQLQEAIDLYAYSIRRSCATRMLLLGRELTQLPWERRDNLETILFLPPAS